MNLWCVSATEPDYPSGRRGISIPLRQASLLITENSGEGGRFLPTKAQDRLDPRVWSLSRLQRGLAGCPFQTQVRVGQAWSVVGETALSRTESPTSGVQGLRGK